MSYTTRFTPLTDDPVAHCRQNIKRNSRPIRRHEILAFHGADGDRVVIASRVAHHAGVEETNAWDDIHFGTTSIEHWYGIPDAANPDGVRGHTMYHHGSTGSISLLMEGTGDDDRSRTTDGRLRRDGRHPGR